MTDTTDRMPLDELAESLTGWEELALHKAFGFSVAELEDHGTLGIRSLAFVELKREGMKDSAAHKAAMDMTLRDLIARYPEMEENPDDPMASIRKDEAGEG
jgi:hypothetical protein